MRTLSTLVFAGTVAVVNLLAACTAKSGPTATFGILTKVTGASAPVTFSNGVGEGFSMSASLDSSAVTNGSYTSWYCYVSSPSENFPNFQIYSSDGSTFTFLVDVVPAKWAVGQLAIDNSTVSLKVATPTFFSVATSGILTLSAAGVFGDTPGNNCAFSASNLTLSAVSDGL